MRRVIVPAVLTLALIAGSAQNASAFGHLKALFGGNNCDSCCEPACGFEPACGVEPVCCEPVCATPKRGLLSRLFCKKDACCDAPVCEPACGFEPACAPACEPVCGCEPICEPICGCEPACCDSAPRCNLLGSLKKIFSRNNHGCDGGCGVIEPACGCEPTCGF